MSLPEIVKAGDPVLHEPAQEIDPDEIRSEIDDMVKVMRKVSVVEFAAPQIIITLEDTEEYIGRLTQETIKRQDRHPFDLLVILYPKLKVKNNRTALLFEGCLGVDGYRAMVERYLDIEVTSLGRDGHPSKLMQLVGRQGFYSMNVII